MRLVVARWLAMPWTNTWTRGIWILRPSTAAPWFQTIHRRFKIVSRWYLVYSILPVGYSIVRYALSIDQRANWRDFDAYLTAALVLTVCPWLLMAAAWYVCLLVATSPKRSRVDHRIFWELRMGRRMLAKGYQPEQIVLRTGIWSGPVKSVMGAERGWKGRSWPPRPLLSAMESESPVVASDGSGLWYDAGSGHSVVLSSRGVLTWIEKRDMRPELEKYLRLLSERRRKPIPKE